MAQNNTNVHIISYNILSHALIASHTIDRDPACLTEEYRFTLLKAELTEFINSNQKPIFCLQEVSQSWSNKLLVFFIKENYHFYWVKGFSKFNDYMGVAIAWPNEIEATNIMIYTPSELIPKMVVKPKSMLERLVDLFYGIFCKNTERAKNILAKNKLMKDWKASSWKTNCCLAIEFKSPNKNYIVSTYHMPCAYKNPLVMILHVVAYVKCAYNMLANRKDVPLFLTGDFNSLPDSFQYKFLCGSDYSDETLLNDLKRFDLPVLSDYITNTTCNLRSGYDPEPIYTNKAFYKYDNMIEGSKFEGCIDYIFVNDICDIKENLHIRRLHENEWIPSFKSPSDHLPIGISAVI